MINKSFALVRTNPALTGNVKVVVTSEYRLYLESFPVTTTLSKERYKHFEVKNEEYYKEVVPIFFADTELDTIFAVKKDDDKALMHNNYDTQFDSTYNAGGSACQDTWYPEEHEYLAPLHTTKKHLPSHFVILRVDGSGLSPVPSSSANFRAEWVDKWKFITSFDLTERSSLGTWLRKNFLDDESAVDYALRVNHEELIHSQLAGIDVDKGGWTTKYLDLSDVFAKNTPIFRTEEFLTGLWRENGLLYPQLLNLQFLFDDIPATPTRLLQYGLNRYAGFYVDAMPVVKTISPYTGFELKKAHFEDIRNLDAIGVSTIPYVRDNVMVREVNGRMYNFDPITNGWDAKKTYWVEFNGAFYKLQRIVNESTTTLGDWTYKIIADIPIEHVVTEPNPAKAVLRRRVLINELSTNNTHMTIKHQIVYNDVVATNIIQNTKEVVTRLVRLFETVDVEGVPTLLYRLDFEDVPQGNAFAIENFNDADLFLMRIGDQHYVVKQHDTSIPVIGGMYYLQTDWAVDVNGDSAQGWINNGNLTRDPRYYKAFTIQNLAAAAAPTVIDVVRVQFSDVQDFDFERVESAYSRYEYEQDTRISTTLENKLYAKEYRDTSLSIKTVDGNRVRRLPITDLNDRPYNRRAFNGELNPYTNAPYTADELYQKNFDGSWKLFKGTYLGIDYNVLKTNTVNVPRRYYREEGYVLKFEGTSDEIDFRPNSLPTEIGEGVSWGADGTAEVSDDKAPLDTINFHTDPNAAADANYVPVSSEYVQSDELFEVRNNDLTDIWNKNQSVCKWGALNSRASHDLPYRLNYSLAFGGLFNAEPNVFSGLPYPSREHKDLDYFYRFGLTTPADYDFYSLHLKDSYFDADKYLSTELDYFNCLFSSDYLTAKGIRLGQKYSSFLAKNVYEEPATLFKGIKYRLLDVAELVIDEEEYKASGRVIIDELVTVPNINYDNYKFSVIFGRKVSRSQKNPGAGSRNLGIDVYLNDYWKNVVVHVYVNTDEIVEVFDYVRQQLVNIETCEIDVLYQDTAESELLDPDKWGQAEFTINELGVNLRARHLTLANVLRILGNYNYQPEADNMDAVGFIHMYADGSVSKIMDYKSTDFLLKTEQPTAILVDENAYQTTAGGASVELVVNNSVKNRIILGAGEFSTNGFKVGSLTDVNAYNDYPVARQILPRATPRSAWELDETTTPKMYRFSTYYAPVFHPVPLFRPLNHQQGVSLLPVGNWKFYDRHSDATQPNLLGFGRIEEVVFSKVNPTTNVLKIHDDSGKNRSIYPMVDEYGYDFTPRYLFASNWEADFYYLSRLIEMPPNEYPSAAGYTLSYNGTTSYLRIADADKFNLERFLVEEVNYEGYVGFVPWQEAPYAVTRPTLFVTLGDTDVALQQLSPAIKALWGGYLKRETQEGDILQFPFKVKNWTDTVNNRPKLLTDLGILFPGNVTSTDYGIALSSTVNFAFEPERWTYVKDGASLVYIGTQTGSNGAAATCAVVCRLYLNAAPATLDFTLTSNLGTVSAVRVTTRAAGVRRPVAAVLADVISQAALIATVSSDETNPDYTVLTFSAIAPGFGYNFDINTYEAESFFVTKRTFAPQERLVKEAFNKTSLKEGLKRVTGYIADLTVEFWVKPTATGKRYETFLYKGADTTADVWRDPLFNDFTWMVGKYDKTNKVAFKTAHKRVDGKVVTHTAVSRAALPVGKWTHVAVVSDALNQSKSIYLNGVRDTLLNDYLHSSKTLPDRELVAEFLSNRQRFLPGAAFSKIGNETALADRIRNAALDAVTVKWFDVIRGFKTLTTEEQADMLWQKKAWGASLPEAYALYKQYRNCYNYYLHTDLTLSWDMLLGTDSVVRNGRRNLAGSLDELRVWNYARTGEQLLANFRFILRPESFLNPLQSLVAYYRFDDGFANSTVHDLMGGKLIKDVTKWARIHEETTNDGQGVVTRRNEDHFFFETAFYDGADVSVPADLGWILSGADLLGYSDDRYTAPAPLSMVSTATVSSPAYNQSVYVEKSLALALPQHTNADTKQALTKPLNTTAPVTIKTKIRLPKPVPNVFSAPDPVIGNATPEPLPQLIRTATASTAILNASGMGTAAADNLEIPTENLRAEKRISSNDGDNSTRGNVFKRLFALIKRLR